MPRPEKERAVAVFGERIAQLLARVANPLERDAIHHSASALMWWGRRGGRLAAVRAGADLYRRACRAAGTPA